MNTLTIESLAAPARITRDVPATARGRALYTVDWFLHGRVQARQHDQASLTLSRLNNQESTHVYA